MKKTTLAVALMAFAITSFSQSTPPDVKTKDYYLTKSKHQKTAAWIMLGGGAALTGISILTVQASLLDYATGDENAGNGANVIAGIGVASMLGSIPLFISAGHNKRKAAEVTFNMQKIPALPVVANRGVFFQPALRVKIAL